MITIENDEFENDLYELIQENEEILDSLERYERSITKGLKVNTIFQTLNMNMSSYILQLKPAGR